MNKSNSQYSCVHHFSHLFRSTASDFVYFFLCGMKLKTTTYFQRSAARYVEANPKGHCHWSLMRIKANLAQQLIMGF